MQVILGVDIGGSTTKIIALNENKECVSTLQVKAADQLTAVYGAIGNLLHSNKISFDQVKKIVLTGVGSSKIEGNIYDIPSYKVPEFEAIGYGGLMLSGLKETIVISMGTGTAYVHATESGSRHIGGSGVGGGTILGLAEKMIGVNDIDSIIELARSGNLDNVDLFVSEMSNMETTALPSDVTASNFGKVRSCATKEDMASGILNMIFQTIGLMAAFACRNTDIKTVVATGSVAAIPQAKDVLDAVGNLCKIDFIIPKEAKFATAIGAASLCFDRNL